MLDCPCQGCMLYRYNNPKACGEAQDVYKSCMTDMLRMTRDEKKTYFLNKIHSFQVRVTPRKKHKFVFVVASTSFARRDL
jgi:hypothetical protein